MNISYLKQPAVPRVAPFIVFMAFIGIEQALRALLDHRLLEFDPTVLGWLYLPKAVLVGLMLWFFRCSYTEINIKDLSDYRTTALSIFSGLLVFILWINMTWTLGAQNTPAGFNPEVFGTGAAKLLMIAVRVTGAVVIVPVMEELFWRSFLLRYLTNRDFLSVPIGHFSLFAFVAVVILFGLEHHYLFAGIMAGIVLHFIYYTTRSIAHCILSHAVANLSLAGYVMINGKWNFW